MEFITRSREIVCGFPSGSRRVADAMYPHADNVFESLSCLRFSRISDGARKFVLLLPGPSLTQDSVIVLLGISPIDEISGS